MGIVIPKTKHLIDPQPPRNLPRNEQHRDLPLELVDRLGEVLGRLLIEVRNRLINLKNSVGGVQSA